MNMLLVFSSRFSVAVAAATAATATATASGNGGIEANEKASNKRHSHITNECAQ